MTNTYNTLNPLGSTSAKDLSDNASNFDEGSNSLAPSFYDRFKRRRQTWAGMEKMVQDFLEAMGFEATHLTYVDGAPLTVLRPTQLIDRAGSVYKVKQPASFPVSLTGAWATDQLLLIDVGDAALRFDLSTMGTSIVAKSTQTVDTIADLRALLKTSVSRYAYVARYLSSGPLIGSTYLLDTSDSTSVDDGGSVIVATDGGRWKLIFSADSLSIEQFGAIPSNTIDSTANIQNAIIALYNIYGGGTLNHRGTFRFNSQIQLYPGVVIKGVGIQKSALEYYGAGNTVAMVTVRPSGYLPSSNNGAGLTNTSLIRRGGTIFDGTIGIDLNLCTYFKLTGVYIALWDRAITHNATNSNRGTIPFAVSQQDFWNEITQCEITTCRYGQTYYGASNRNTSGTNNYVGTTVCHDFTSQYSSSETNYFYQENYEGCDDWALWRTDNEFYIYTNTWVSCTFENPASRGVLANFRDPGHQVLINMSIIPPNNPAAVQVSQVYAGVYSTWLGTGTADRYVQLGFKIPEEMHIYRTPRLGARIVGSYVYAGTIAANSFTQITIPLAEAQLNDIVTVCALRDLNGCQVQGWADSGVVKVNISNPTTSPKTITSTEISATIARAL